MEADGRKRNKKTFAQVILSPLVLLNKGLTNLLRNSVGEDVTEDDILEMVDAGNENGTIEAESVEMINNIFEYNDLCASDVMTHRINITAVDINASLDDIIYLALDRGFSRLPVYEESVDKIIGIIIVKDLLCLIGKQDLSDFSINDYVRDAIYIPENCTCGNAFKYMTHVKTGMAVVVDEYGGTAGIVTLEDIIESVMGNIQDEYDTELSQIRKIGYEKYEINGEADPDEVLELFGYTLPDDHEYDTISGFVTDILGYLPEEIINPPHADYNDIRFVITDVKHNCIERIIAFRNQ